MYIDPTSRIAKDARILIIDDEERNIHSLTRLIERAGYAICISVMDPLKAVERFEALQPDIVLLDWHLGEISGLNVLQAIKAKIPEETTPPILVLTGDSSPETKHEALTAGAWDFLSKPLDGPEVLLRIRNLLQLRALHQRSRNAAEALEERVKERTAELERTVTELREVQQQVLQQERLHALGLMAAGVAHDFDNVLMIIRGYSDMFLDRRALPANSGEIRDCFATISRVAGDAAEIVRRLRDFQRPFASGEDERQPVNLNELVHECVKLTRPKWLTGRRAEGFEIEVDCELIGVPPIPASPSELREVLVNLLFNSVDAMPHGGRITIRTGAEGEHVFIEVQDTGMGMSDEARQRCMEPFFSTKGERGSGLGLAILYGIVRRHNGLIRIQTEVDRGTRVKVLLPKTVSLKERPEQPASVAPLRGLRVLVVDDQPPICVVLRHYLQQDSHTVVTAANGEEGLAKFKEGSFDVVIADRVMPKMNGDQLATAIKGIEPKLPVILLTAFGEASNTPEDVDLLVNKPASLHTLRDALTKVLAA
jgi:signal transduction histidine kinase